METPEQRADGLLASEILGGRARFMTRGATCTVFTDGQFVLRISDPNPGKAARFQVDAQIRQKLHAAGVPTTLTVKGGAMPDGRAYSVEPFLRDDQSTPSREGWTELGRALNILHRLPHERYGLLLDRPDKLRGSCLTATEGFNSRLQQAWPFTGQALESHPMAWLIPERQLELRRLEPELRALADLPTAVCHTDLHAGQCLWLRGHLLGLLDFGDACIGPPAWDWASLAYFHGWDVAALVANKPLGRQVALLGLLISFHRASRAVTLNRPQRSQEAVKFARQCLERL